MESKHSPAQNAGLNTCLVGTLADWPLPEILLWLHQSERTAMLRIGDGLDGGVVFFRNGYLFRCEWGKASGEEALLALLQHATGSFVLIQREIPEVHANIKKPTPELLLQLTVSIDEARRHHVAS